MWENIATDIELAVQELELDSLDDTPLLLIPQPVLRASRQAEIQHSIERATLDITRIRRAAQHLKRARALCVARRRALQALLNPSRALPLEILGDISTRAMLEIPGYSIVRLVHALGQVCVYWRYVVFHHPPLWSRIFLMSFASHRNELTKWVERSGNFPLQTIAAVVVDNPGWWQQLAHRTQYLQITQLIGPVLSKSLETLILGEINVPSPMLNTHHWDLPKLHTLHITQISIGPPNLSLFSQLRQLALSFYTILVNELSDVITSCTTLQ